MQYLILSLLPCPFIVFFAYAGVGTTDIRRSFIDFNLGQSFVGREILQYTWKYIGVLDSKMKGFDSKELIGMISSDLKVEYCICNCLF